MCESRYTINRNTGEFIRCSGVHLKGNPFRDEVLHSSEYGGTTWYWNDREADKEVKNG